MSPRRYVSMKSASLILTSALLLVSPWLSAFPPAPYYTIYGLVRDQVGQTLNVEGATLILLKGESEVGRTSIVTGLQLDQNYKLAMRIDQNRSGTTLYSGNAIAAQSLYSLVVEMNGARFYPIEVSGNLSTGKGGERVRLDLNLGEDTDGDGLPDIWEMWQLYQAGYLPDASGRWPLHLITRNGDLDKDGKSDWIEYVAGTFAGDADESFALEIKEKTTSSLRFEFYAIAGKAYSLERSTDIKTWTRMPFAVGTGPGALAYTGTDSGILSAFAKPAPGGATEFYRLTVR